MAELMFKYKIFCVGAFCKVAQLLSSWQWHRGYSMGGRIAFVPTWAVFIAVWALHWCNQDPALALHPLPFTWAQSLALRGKWVEKYHRGERWNMLVVFSIVCKLGHGHSISLAGLVNSPRFHLGKLSCLLGASDNLLKETQSYKPLTNSQNMILLIFSIFSNVFGLLDTSLHLSAALVNLENVIQNVNCWRSKQEVFFFPPFPPYCSQF